MKVKITATVEIDWDEDTLDTLTIDDNQGAAEQMIEQLEDGNGTFVVEAVG